MCWVGKSLNATGKDLYNGNIATWTSKNTKLSPNNWTQQFEYDQLNRIKNGTSYNFTVNGTLKPDAFKNSYKYDPNGNITDLMRYSRTGDTLFDNLHYNYENTASSSNYKQNTNKLRSVDEPTSFTGLRADDIDDQDVDNYKYDEVGNLVFDDKEDIAKIEWTVSGKISKILRETGSSKSDLEFAYDPMGHRTSKTVYTKDTQGKILSTTNIYYVRDATGNIMANYSESSDKPTDGITLQEFDIYGSSRLGTLNNGQKEYELTDHLGNVRTVLNDNGLVASATDYYPFGMVANSYSKTAYRYGFNGKEKNDEISAGIYDLGSRNFDSRLCRMFSTDPIETEYPWQSTYAYYRNTPIAQVDFNGEGDYYGKDGKHLGSDGRTKTVGSGANAKQVADNIAYVSSPETIKSNTKQDGTVDWDAVQKDSKTTNLTSKYGLENSDLIKRANWAYGEGGGNYLDYYAHTINNLRQHGVWGPANKPYSSDEAMFKEKMTHRITYKDKKTGKKVKKIINMYSGYFNGTAGSPSAKKFALKTGNLTELTNDATMKAAIGAVIGSVTGQTKDPTNGAYQWVGGAGKEGGISRNPGLNNATNVTNVVSGDEKKGEEVRFHTFYSYLKE